MTLLHVICGLALPQSKILATPMHRGGAFWAVPLPQITPCPSQKDQQTFAQKQVTTNAFFLLKQKTDRVNAIK